MSILEVRDLTLRFGGLEVINQLSLKVDPGGIVSLIGPNGAGKTSVFNCLTGFYRASAGDITFNGESIIRLKPHRITRRGMARTFQNLRLFKNMTVLENVMSGMHCRTRVGALGAILRNPAQRAEELEIRRVAEECLDFVGILDHKDRLSKNLPYGDQRRVEWARALATRPTLLLLDEPAAGLRYREKQALADLLRRLKGEGMSVLLVEHDMDFVMNLVDRLVVMDFGERIATGLPREIQTHPAVLEAYLGGVE